MTILARSKSDLIRWTAVVLLFVSLSPSRAYAVDPIHVYAAGSLAGVMQDLIAQSGLPADVVAPPTFGPAGSLAKRLQAGEHADLFASADLARPLAVAQGRLSSVIAFARNRMCVLAPERLGLTSDNLLERMLSPHLRLATSTPGADPGGDYALEVFARAETVHPGAGAMLRGKALLLLGGPGSMGPKSKVGPAAAIFLNDQADTLLYYCSGAEATARKMPDLAAIPVPDALEVDPVYGLAILSDRPEAARLALFMVSQQGQAILTRNGLLPLVRR